MFNNVLIAEDHRSTKLTVEQIVKDLGIPHSQYVYYCDDALLQLKNGIKNNEAFELFITDLSFAADSREQKIKDGTTLIEAVKKLQPDLRILVFSSEPNPAVVSTLFQKFAINAYVYKGRRDTIDLKEAIEAVYNGKKYVSSEFQQAIRQKNTYDFDDTELIILSQLAQGTKQINIPDSLKAQGQRATSLSSIEKRLKHIRETLGFTTNEQLIAYCKDYRII